MGNTPRDKIAAVKTGIVSAIGEQVEILELAGTEEGTAIVTSALIEVLFNFMLMHYGAEYTERAIKRALKEFFEKIRPN